MPITISTVSGIQNLPPVNSQTIPPQIQSADSLIANHIPSTKIIFRIFPISPQKVAQSKLIKKFFIASQKVA